MTKNVYVFLEALRGHRTSDVLFAFPGILLAIAIVAILGTGLFNVVVAVSVFSMPTFARIVRASTLALKESL